MFLQRTPNSTDAGVLVLSPIRYVAAMAVADGRHGDASCSGVSCYSVGVFRDVWEGHDRAGDDDSPPLNLVVLKATKTVLIGCVSARLASNVVEDDSLLPTLPNNCIFCLIRSPLTLFPSSLGPPFGGLQSLILPRSHCCAIY